MTTPANHIANFEDNISEINELTSIHTQIAGNTRGRKSKVQILNKSSVILLTACWEYYVEDLAREAFKFMLENASDHDSFPFSVLAKASKELKNDKDDRRVWKLAGDGWKDVLKNYQETTLEKEIDHFHVPRPENIDLLYSKLLGINNITQNWYWQKMSNNNALTTLNRFIDLRGEIAHNVKTTQSVRKKDADDYRKFIFKLAVILHNRVNEHINNETGTKPWQSFRYGTVK